MQYYSRCNGMVYVVKPGDTLYTISRNYQIPMAVLMEANPEIDIYNLRIGSRLCIPVVCRQCRPEYGYPSAPRRPMRTRRPVHPQMPPMEPWPVTPPMGPGPVKPPMGPGTVKPPMGPGPVMPPTGQGPVMPREREWQEHDKTDEN